MVFSSLTFLCIFLPAVLILYNLSKNVTYKNIILVISSLLFYAWGEPVWVIALIFSALVDYAHGFIIDRYYGTKKATAALISSLVLNLGILVFFKYSSFITESISGMFSLGIKPLNIGLPLGISFYTFQTLSYTIDMYRGRTRLQTSLLRFMVYVSMFPQLVAGPIVRYDDIAPSLRSRSVSWEDFTRGARRFCAGLCKKVILANNAGSAASVILDGSLSRLSAGTAWIGIIMYAFQIYFDFSGYSDMAIGLGSMLGFKFKENFDYPYIAGSITDFWRRWHISLSSFFRDYVYIPLGGNRYKPVRNILIVWLLTGLWHGAGWNFILWGLYYGILLIIEKYAFKGILRSLPPPISCIYTLFLVVFGWALFYYTDISKLLEFIPALFGKTAVYDFTTLSSLYSNLWLIIVCVIASTPIPRIIYTHLCKISPKFALISEPVLLAAGFIASLILISGQSYNPFLYFRF